MINVDVCHRVMAMAPWKEVSFATLVSMGKGREDPKMYEKR